MIRTETIGNATLYLGDCLEMLPTLDREAAIVADPPYGMKNNTDSRRFSGGSAAMVERRKSQRDNKWPVVVGDDKPFDPAPWLGFARVVLWGCNHYGQQLPNGTTLVWIKKLEGGYGTFQSDAELAWMKGGKGVYCRRDTSFRSNMKDRQHPNQKPLGVMAWCIEKVGDVETIIDPYMGSGTTGIAALRAGKRFIGIEWEPQYFDAACKRHYEFENSPKELALAAEC